MNPRKRNIGLLFLCLTMALGAQVTVYNFVQTDPDTGLVGLPTGFWESNSVPSSNALKSSFIPSASAPSLGSTPGTNRYYGTDSGGTKQWIAFPAYGTGDMLRATYDADLDTIVDSAEAAPWAGITGKPNTFPPEAHVHAGADITSGTVVPARLGSGTANGSTFLRGDGVWASPSGGLADAPSDGFAYARSNANWSPLGNAASRNVGTTTGTVAAGDDSRLLTAGEKTDLIDGGDSGAHFHSADRARANHTGTQAKSTISDFAHASTHQAGQADALSGNLDATARTMVRKNSGADVGARRRINFSEGSGVSLTIADDPANEEIDIVMNATEGGGTNTPTLDQNNVFTGPTNTFQRIVATSLFVSSGIDDDDVAFDDVDNVWNATSIGAALEELNNSINGGTPNGTGAKLHWSQLLGVPAGFQDGTDDGGGGGGITEAPSNGVAHVRIDGGWQTNSFSNTAGTASDGQIPSTIARDSEVAAAYQPLDSDLTTLAALNGSGLTNLNGTEIRSGTVADARIDAAIARDAEVAAAYQPLDSDLTDLADGSLTGSKVGSGIDAGNITAGIVGTARLGSGTANSTTFLRGDGTWAAGGGGGGGDAFLANSQTWIGATNKFSNRVEVLGGFYTPTQTVDVLNIGTVNLGTNIIGLANGGTGGTNAATARSNIGAQASDADLDDLADGSLTGSKVGSGINGANITTGTIDSARLDSDLQDLADGSLTPSKLAHQSGRLPGRAEGFGQVVRNVGSSEPLAAPTEPALLLLTPIGGQSLATGSGGVTNSFSTTPRHPGYSLMWGQGVHHGEPGTGGVVIASSSLSNVADLYANVVTGPTRSETPVVAAVDMLNTVWSNRLGGQRVKVLAAAHGLGGANLNSIDEGTASFSNLLAHIDGAKAYADSWGWQLNMPVWWFAHGENDTFDGTPTEAYRTNFLRMYETANTRAKAVTGQTNDVVVVMSQTASATYENVASANSFPAFAQYFLGLSDSRIKVAVPTYIFPTVADGVHFTNVVSAWFGEYLSKAARRELFGGGWNPLMPTNVSIVGTNVVLKYHVPAPPLAFDTTQVTDPGNYGFSLTGATIQTPIISANSVLIPFTGGTPTRVKYGVNGTAGQPDGPTTGQRGNLRDSEFDLGSLTGSNLYNWSLIFDLPTTAPAAPTSLTASGANGKITLAWNRMADTAYYLVRRSTVSGGPYETIATTNGTLYVDAHVSSGTTYYYTVFGHGPSGDSASSAEVTASTSGGGSITRDWIPTDLGSKLAGWYRASSIGVGDGNPIDTWVDESGNGYNLTASSTTRPTQQTVSTRKVVRFDGTDDRLDQASIGTKFNAVPQLDVFTVGSAANTNASGYWWWLSRASNTFTRVGAFNSTTLNGAVRFGGTRVATDGASDTDNTTNTFSPNVTTIHHQQFDFANSDKRAYWNGTLDVEDSTFASAGNTEAENPSLFRLGASNLGPTGGPTNWWAGDLEIVIATSGALTSTEREKVEGYVAHALGITNLLGGSHPYKSTAPTITVGSSDLITSVDSDFEVVAGELSLTNTVGTGPIVRQSAAGGGTSVFVNDGSVSGPNFESGPYADLEVVGTNITVVPTRIHSTTLSFASTNTLVLTTNAHRTLVLTGDSTFATGAISNGVSVTVLLQNTQATNVALVFPGQWTFMNVAMPSSLAAGKDAILALQTFGTASTNVYASYAAEP